MNKGLAFINAQAIFTNLLVMHPDWLSSFTNYGCCFDVTVQVPENEEKVKEEIRVLRAKLLEGAELEMYNNRTIKRWVISIHWRRLE